VREDAFMAYDLEIDEVTEAFLADLALSNHGRVR
jgi:hypothetical protein